MVWTTPPRSLEECQQLDPLETHTVCPETPHEFVSEPGIIYVADPEQKRFVQTRLKGIDCVNETGRTNRPNVNPDEVVVAFTSVSTDLASLKDLEDEHGFGVIKMNLNAGDKRRPDDVIGSVPVGLGDTATGVLMVGEDDVYSPKIWIRSHLAGILASMVGFNAGGPIGAVAAGASTEFGTALLLSVLDKPDPDDPIGRAAWSSTVAQIDVRGTASHDSDLSNAVPALVRKEELLEHIRAGTAGVHPAVDLIAYSANDQLLSCAMDGECESGRRCYLGACVPMGWSDPTLPLEYDPASDVAGTIERWDMDGSRSDYRVYVSTSVSAKNRP